MKPLSAPIFDIQRFSIHDGPGIRTTVFFKGCNLACDWCQNPESQSVTPLVSFYENRCDQHFACARACPENAISKDGFRIDYARCSRCLQCIEACPNGALQLIGKSLGPAQLFEQLLADKAYYESSDGGVTFSGGEPTLYPAFIERVLGFCEEHSIHTTLETCGTFSQKRWTSILPRLNLIYFDLKIIDAKRHKQATGSSNRRILENARYLTTNGYPVEFRLPLVPGLTDDPDNLEKTADFLKALGQSKIHLLGYHRMGEAKIDIIQGKQKKLGLQNYAADKLADVAQWFEQRRIATAAT